MIIDKAVLEELSAKAKASPRLRMAMDLRNSSDDGSQRMLNALEPGTVLLEAKDGAYRPIGPEDVMDL